MQQAQRFSVAAPADGVAPVRILMPSPIGALGVELRSTVVTRVVIDPAATERATFTPLHKMCGGEPLDEVCGRLAEYFAGARRKLDVEWSLAPSGCTGFARRVLKETAKIPYGKTRTFESLAEVTGRPDAHPQVLAALLTNPIPIVIACHRVIAADGGLGGYVAGIERKRWLLSAESAPRLEL
ncbi:MAG TPA: methylated-DNA--[protein]-cysteine S-methyltransferase [Thermoanaerobaculia bacterium]|nr:methylated-DNA--[protein]-cysteine S-methyltransferase [Thermoanaerobaculia bacterium]